jgi:DNA (cytosine-5)-methyltransferase 1
MTLTVGSLFSGIGGIDLGLERVGMTVKWQSEIEPYSCRVLEKHWPDVPNLGNIREINWEEVERVDVIAGGYPCQPFSNAGKRGGSDDPRHLWPEMLRAISVLRPRVAFLENVRGHYSLGFDRVLGDLADIGYDCECDSVSAQSVGAPHRRERLICLAYTDDSRSGASRTDFDKDGSQDVAGWSDQSQSELGRFSHKVANPDIKFVGQHGSSDDVGCFNRIWRNNSRRQETNDIGQWWATEPDVGRVAYGIPARVDRLKGLGNAVVPQVAEVVGRVIVEMLT